MPTKLKDTLEKVRKLENKENSQLLLEFYDYLSMEARTSERYQSDILKVLIKFSEFVDCDLSKIEKRDKIVKFLDSKRKSKEVDHDERWIKTWNDYLWRIKYFFRWLHNSTKSRY